MKKSKQYNLNKAFNFKHIIRLTYALKRLKRLHKGLFIGLYSIVKGISIT